MTETRITNRLDRETFRKGTTLIVSFNPNVIFANDSLDAWYVALKHLEPEIYMLAVRNICITVKWFHSTNLALEVLKIAPGIAARKTDREEAPPPQQSLVQRERNAKLFKYLGRCFENGHKADEQLVQDVVDGIKDISAFETAFETEDLQVGTDKTDKTCGDFEKAGYPASWDGV